MAHSVTSRNNSWISASSALISASISTSGLGAYGVSAEAGIISPAYWVMRPDLRFVEPAYLHHFLRSDPYRTEIRRLSKDMPPNGYELPWSQFRQIRFPLLSIEVQRAIADYLDAETARIDALIAKKRRMVELLVERLSRLANQYTVEPGCSIPLRRMVKQVKTGTTPPASVFARLQDGDSPWYSPSDVGSWIALNTPSRSLNEAAVREGWVPVFPKGSTLVVGIGATAGRVAHLARQASGNQQMTCLVPGPRILPRFLSWQLFSRTDELRETAPFTTLPILNNDFLQAVLLFVPSIEDQAVVIAHLDELAAKTTQASHLLGTQIALLGEHRQALITAAVTGELPVPGVAA